MLGHILHLGPERIIKQTIFEIFKSPQDGDMLMDAPKTSSWKDMCEFAINRDCCMTVTVTAGEIERGRALRQPRVVEVSLDRRVEAGTTIAVNVPY